MGMNRDVRFTMLKRNHVWILFEQIVHEFLEEETAFRDLLGIVDLQFAIVFHKHRPARWFEE